jgi:hypothetical protein
MISNFNNLQDASGPRKPLQETLRNRYWTAKGKRTSAMFALMVARTALAEDRNPDPSGTDLPGLLEAASRQRLKSLSWSITIDLP